MPSKMAGAIRCLGFIGGGNFAFVRSSLPASPTHAITGALCCARAFGYDSRSVSVRGWMIMVVHAGVGVIMGRSSYQLIPSYLGVPKTSDDQCAILTSRVYPTPRNQLLASVVFFHA